MGGAAFVEQDNGHDSVHDVEALSRFKQGLAQLQKGFARDAVEKLQSAVELQPRNAYFLSYYGLALGLAQRQWSEAESLCAKALQLKRTVPQLYLNLADVYEYCGRKADAVEILCVGLRYTGRDSRIQAALRGFGVRRPPVLSFLSRKNVLNRCLGKWRHTIKV